jgi:serine/threonine-protein kinase
MRQAISDAGDALAPPGPLLLAGMIDRADPHPTRAVPDPTARLFDQDAPDAPPVVMRAPEPVDATLVVETERERRERTGQRRLVPIVVAIVLLITIALATAALAQVRGAKPIKIPGIEGLTETAAKAQADPLGITLVKAGDANSPDPPGTILQQDPRGGTFTSGRRVSYVLSLGPAKIPVPGIEKQLWANAERMLTAKGLAFKITRQFDDVAAKDTVLSVQPPSPTLVDPNATLNVLLSDGHAPVKILDVVKLNYTYKQAVDALTFLHFKTRRAAEDVYDDKVKAGNVVRTEPAVNTEVPYQSEVTIVVSKGPELIPVPGLLGRDPDVAQQIATDRGFVLFVEGRLGNRVTGQFPAPGTLAKKGSEISVTFSRCIVDFFCI